MKYITEWTSLNYQIRNEENNRKRSYNYIFINGKQIDISILKYVIEKKKTVDKLNVKINENNY